MAMSSDVRLMLAACLQTFDLFLSHVQNVNFHLKVRRWSQHSTILTALGEHHCSEHSQMVYDCIVIFYCNSWIDSL